MPFSGVASKTGSWTSDDDRLARTIEILGNFRLSFFGKETELQSFLTRTIWLSLKKRSADNMFSRFY